MNMKSLARIGLVFIVLACVLVSGFGYFLSKEATAEAVFITAPTTPSGWTITGNNSTSCNLSGSASEGADYYTIVWDTADYPSTNATGTQGYTGVSLTPEITGLSAVTTYISVWAISTDGTRSTCSAVFHLLRSYEGFEGFTDIYWSLTEEDADNDYLATAANETKVYLGLMGLSLNLSNTKPSSNAITFFKPPDT